MTDLISNPQIPNEELDIFKSLQNIKVVFDVGAREDLSYYELKPECEYHLFEPNKEATDILEKKIKTKNIILNKFGISDENKDDCIYYLDSQSFQPNPYIRDSDVGIRYSVRKLDDYVKENNIKYIDFLKIDTEGFDYKVLKGGQETIQSKVSYLQFEYWDGVKKFTDILPGFKLFLMIESRLLQAIRTKTKDKKYNLPLVPLDYDVIALIDKKLIPMGAGGNIFGIKREIYVENLQKKFKTDVVIPVYNGEKFILDTLNSVTQQTLLPQNIIVVDDGSTDNTNKIVSDYANNSKVKIEIVRKENGGLSSARNAGIKTSTADFIAFLDADDIWVNNKLEKQLDVFKSTEFGNLGLVYCKYDLINETGEKTTGYILPLDKKVRGYAFNKVLETNKILSSGSGVLARRDVFENVGLFDEELKFGEDWDMWIRIAEKFEVDYVDETLVHIRRHSNNMSASLLSVFEGEIEFYNKWIPKLKNKHPIPLAWSDRIIFRMIKISPRNGLVSMLKKKMRPDVYKELFTKKFASIYLYMAIFPVRMIIKTILSPRNLLKLIK